jgi:transcriptional regulator with XRE-family HTH domain
MEPVDSLSDDAILRELGHRLARHRIAHELTQAALASQAGIAKRTVERIEAGESSQVVSLIRVLRVLGLLEGLGQLVPDQDQRPMALLKARGKERRRASPRPRGATPTARPWTWGDEP